MKLRGIIFDLDGVITDTAEYHYKAWKQIARSINIEIDREFNEKLKGISRVDSLERILALDTNKIYSSEEKALLAESKNEIYLKLIQTITPKDILPNILKLLGDSKKENIKLGVASASKNAITILDRLEITNQFDYIVDASQVTHSKPHPEIFLKAIEGLKLDEKSCIGIEDAQAGIESIHGCCMKAVAIGDKLVGSELKLESTEELSLEILKTLF